RHRDHAVHGHVRAARRAGEADAERAHHGLARRVVEHVEGRSRLGIRAAQGTAIPQRDPVTAEDVKFSFERYRGAAAPLFKARVREVYGSWSEPHFSPPG